MRSVRTARTAYSVFHAVLPFLVSAGFAVTCAQTPKPILETNFLVFPRKLPATGQVPTATDLRATVGKMEYGVRAVTPAAGSPDLKTIVVFDLASVPRDYQPCLIQQAKAMAPDLRRMGVTLFVVSFEWTEFHKPFRHGPGELYEYFLPDPKASNRDECASQPPPRRHFGELYRGSERERTEQGPWGGWKDVYGGLATCQSFRGLAEALQSERGPIRVFWIGQNFGWIYRGIARTAGEHDGRGLPHIAGEHPGARTYATQ
jgi:hypothetical protein